MHVDMDKESEAVHVKFAMILLDALGKIMKLKAVTIILARTEHVALQ